MAALLAAGALPTGTECKARIMRQTRVPAAALAKQ